VFIVDYLNKEYHDYSMYTIENRAIPSVIDGLKPVQRKILSCATEIWTGKGTEKTRKIFQLAGATASTKKYHHGDASLMNAITGMAQDFKNNMPLFDREGQFGSLRSTDAGAPRYIGVKLNNNFNKLFKDKNLLQFKEDDGDQIEPKYFLPIIPTVILNGTSGIAVGFATNILNRNPSDVINACLDALDNKPIDRLIPQIYGFDGIFELDIDEEGMNRRWIAKGKIDVVNATTLKITELAPSVTYEKYENYLDGLIENKTIQSYEDKSSGDIHYVIKMTKENLAKMLEKDTLRKIFKIDESLTENINTLDENGRLKYFETEVEVVKYFVEYRLTYYHKRKDITLNDLLRELKLLGSKYKFVKAVVDGELEIKNVPRQSLIDYCTEQNFFSDDGFDYLLRMPIHSLTKETIEKIIKDVKNAKAEYDYIKEKDPVEMYREDLRELLANI
jgi:DNA gyrase/topoisomerase IV subunit A